MASKCDEENIWFTNQLVKDNFVFPLFLVQSNGFQICAELKNPLKMLIWIVAKKRSENQWNEKKVESLWLEFVLFSETNGEEM